MKYEFKIDEEACFAYWAQSLVQWIWLSENRVKKYYEDHYGLLTKEEDCALKNLKNLLQQKDAGFLWLWKRYADLEIKNQEEHSLWLRVQEVLRERFERIWEDEYDKLEAWQKEFNDYSFKKIDNIFIDIAHFFDFDVAKNEKVTVKLLLNHNKNTLAGHAKKEFSDFILLSLSSLDKKYFNMALCVLIHETTHLLEYTSSLSETLLKESYENILKPVLATLPPTHNGPAWHSLFREAMISSMADSSATINAYVNQKLFRQQGEVPKNVKDLLMLFEYQKEHKRYRARVKTAAAQLAPLTKKYLDNHQKMDSAYSDAVARAWLAVQKAEKNF
jgi:hypothetical protein